MRGCAAKFPQKSTVKAGIGFKAVGQGGVDAAAAQGDIPNAVNESPTLNIADYTHAGCLLKESGKMVQRIAGEFSQFPEFDFRFQILFDIVDACLQMFAMFHVETPSVCCWLRNTV